MKRTPKHSDIVPNLLVALAVTLVVNFSYLLLLLVDQPEQPRHPDEETTLQRTEQGILSVHPDGYGYLRYANGDSVYVPQSRIRRFGLEEGDRLVADLTPPRHDMRGAHPSIARICLRNGAEFDYAARYNRPSEGSMLAVQLFYYFLVSFILLAILTAARRDHSMRRFMRACLWSLGAAVLLYLVAPVTEWHTGRILPNFMTGRMLDYMLLLKCSFAVAVTMLYGRIYTLVSQRRAVELENEQLKNENLTTRYNMLVSQINPHFFFNSLNSLAMLVRERQNDKALVYIDQLSYTFRYIIQNGQSTLVRLDEELKFAEAYGYLFKIRYEDKLFFDFEIDDRCRACLLPALSLQPLIGNAVKHNTITSSRPLRITIRTEGDMLVVSNPRHPKLDAEPSTGIGLENLRSRWQLVTGRTIEIESDERHFVVRLPLQKPTHR